MTTNQQQLCYSLHLKHLLCIKELRPRVFITSGPLKYQMAQVRSPSPLSEISWLTQDSAELEYSTPKALFIHSLKGKTLFVFYKEKYILR